MERGQQEWEQVARAMDDANGTPTTWPEKIAAYTTPEQEYEREAMQRIVGGGAPISLLEADQRTLLASARWSEREARMVVTHHSDRVAQSPTWFSHPSRWERLRWALFRR